MKRLVSLLFVLISLSIMVASCQKAPFVTLNAPRSFTFTRDGGTQIISFTCNRDWSVSSSESWIQVSPSSGTASAGEVYVMITCVANTTYDPRSATVTVKVEDLSETISISQDTGIGLIVSTEAIDLTNAAQTIEIEVQKNVQYRISIDDAGKDWITHVSTKGLTSEKAVFSIAANETYDDRVGRITFKQTDGSLSATVVVKQSQTNGLFITTPEYNLSNEAHTLSVEVKANVDYEVTSQADWITRVETKALTASTIVLSIAANKGYDERTGLVYVKQKNGNLTGIITITQKQTDYLAVAPTSFNVTSEAQDITIDVTDNVRYKVIIPDDAKAWITLKTNTQTRALSNDEVVLAVARNDTYDPRETSITLKQENGALSGTVKIVQAQSDTLGVSPTEISLPYSGGRSSVLVETNVNVSATVQGNANWISVSKDAQTRGLDQQSYTIIATENDGDERDAYVLFRGNGKEQRVHVVQSGCPLIVSASTLVADCLDGASLTVQVKAAGTWTVTEKGSSILTVSENNGDAGSSSLTVSFNGANCTNADRIADLEFQCEGLSKTIRLRQVPAFRFDSLDHTIPSTGGSYKFNFHFPRPFQSGTVRTHDYDNGFYQLLYYEGDDNAPDGVSIGEDSSDANPVDTYMYMSYNFKANFAKTPRTGRFRLSFTENGQTLVSEWINVTQQGDPYAGDEAEGVTTVLQQHSKGSGVPLVILGDGFTKADINSGTFAAAARKAYDYFFSVEPITSLREYFDVWSISAISSSNSFNGSTRFGSTFAGGTRINGNDGVAVRYASRVVPSNKTNDMLIIIVMNSTRYAGTCYLHYVDYGSNRVLAYSVAYVPMSEQSGMTFEDVIHHEACGHGLGKLADEYTGNGTIPTSKANELGVFQRAGAYVNVDLHSDVSSTLWADYAADSRFGYENLDAYQGGYTYNYGVYRPSQTSIMVSNKGIFNAPSRAQIYKRVMGIANDWNWTFDYEGFVSFDAPFRSNNYNTSSTMSVRRNYVERDDFVPLAPPVFVKDN